MFLIAIIACVGLIIHALYAPQEAERITKAREKLKQEKNK